MMLIRKGPFRLYEYIGRKGELSTNPIIHLLHPLLQKKIQVRKTKNEVMIVDFNEEDNTVTDHLVVYARHN